MPRRAGVPERDCAPMETLRWFLAALVTLGEQPVPEGVSPRWSSLGRTAAHGKEMLETFVEHCVLWVALHTGAA